MTDLDGPSADARARAGDTRKSRRTRARILDAAMRLFAEIGYQRATNGEIADAAGLTRGAMLYHFPAREALVEAAVGHIQEARAAAFARAAKEPHDGIDAIEHAIDAYWRLLRSPPFVAFAELECVARTDPWLESVLRPAREAFDRGDFGDGLSALFQAGAAPRFQASRDLARFALEGLSRADLAYDGDGRRARLLQVLKRAAHMLNRKGDVIDLWPE
jgi:AcrR family transcriptional regulator